MVVLQQAQICIVDASKLAKQIAKAASSEIDAEATTDANECRRLCAEEANLFCGVLCDVRAAKAC